MANNSARSDFFDVAYSRRSIRDFRPDPVSEELIEQIVQDALTAPSWSNTRPYKIAIATGEVRNRISRALLAKADDILAARSSKLPTRLRGLVSMAGLIRSDFRIPVVYPDDLRRRQIDLAKALYTHLGIARENVAGRDQEIRRNMEFFGAPVGMFIFARKGMGVYSALDAGHFMQTLMLSARARGLDSCAQGFLAFWSAPIRNEFEVPDGYKLLCGMSLGYRSDDHRNDFVPPHTSPVDVMLPVRSHG